MFGAAAGSAVAAGRFRTGRSESSSASGGGDEDASELAAAGRFRTGRFESFSSAGVSAGAGEGEDAAGAVPGAEVEGAGDAGAAGGALPLDEASSGAFGFGLARLSTGGPSGSSGAGFDMTAFRLAAASFLAAISASDCQVPLPTQVLLPCSALPTVNNPKETPERKPSYTVPLSSAMGTGVAL